MSKNLLIPINICQMGKVGSESIYMSLKKIGILNPLYHTHLLNETSLLESNKIAIENKIPKTMQYEHSISFLSGLEIYTDVKLISAVRDPIAQIISSIFQNLKIRHKSVLDSNGNPNQDKVIALIVESLNKYSSKNPYENCNWFDTHIKEVFGFDIYEIPFNKDKGYQIYSTVGFDLLILKLEMSENWEAPLKFFLGLPNFKLERYNDGSKKTYSKFYKEVLNKLKVEINILNKIYSTKYFQYFYTAQEKETFISKWLNF